MYVSGDMIKRPVSDEISVERATTLTYDGMWKFDLYVLLILHKAMWLIDFRDPFLCSTFGPGAENTLCGGPAFLL